MAIDKPVVAVPFATDPTTQADGDLFEAPSFMEQGYTAPGGDPEVPALGHFNWLFHQATKGTRYHNSRGLPDWDEDETEYVAPAAVWHDGAAYLLVGTATPGTEPSDDPVNWAPFGMSLSPDFGDGALGDVTISGTTVAGGNLHYRNLTIGAAGLLKFETPHMLRVQGTLRIQSGGVIRFGHATNINGGNGVTATQPGGGAAGAGMNSLSTGYVGGGASGGRGGEDAGGVLTGGAGALLGTARMGGNGGAGGTGVSAGGATSSATAFTSSVGLTNAELVMAIIAGGRARVRGAGTPPVTSEALLMGGGGGGGGGGPNSATTPPRDGGGGGGGAGGAVGIIVARRVIVEADGAVVAPGGNGGNSSAEVGLGGGGGGGGGWIAIVCGSYSGTTLTAAACCPGGTGGTGSSGDNGAAGSAGRVDTIVVAA